MSNAIGEDFVLKYIIDPTYWTGPNPTYWEKYFIHVFAVIPVGFIWAVALQICYLIVHWISMKYFKKYRSMSLIQRTDWTSRIIALIIIIISVYHMIMITLTVNSSYLVPEKDINKVPYAQNHWHFKTDIDPSGVYWIFRFYTLFFGYELYDLKNCIDIKMYSGVIHHLFILVVIPSTWDATIVSIDGLWVFINGYISNIPAHIRSFLIHLGYRDTKIYTVNKWAWWMLYIICRLIAYPWLSAYMWCKFSVATSQAPFFAVAFLGPCFIVHFALSIYWFIQMSLTLFVEQTNFMKVDSLKVLPTPNGDTVDPSKMNNEGGQKFD